MSRAAVRLIFLWDRLQVLEPGLWLHFISCFLVAFGVVIETGVFSCNRNVADGI